MQPIIQGIKRALKVHYRSNAVQMYITAIENNRPIPNISTLIAMDMLVAAWDEVMPGTINNCFRAAGISHPYPLIDEDVLEEFNHSADANEEEEEEMDEDEIVIVDKPPKPSTQCELRHVIGKLNTFCSFANDAHLNNLQKSTRNIFQIIHHSFSVAKKQQVP